MRKRKFDEQPIVSNTININKVNDFTFFEIGNEITVDIAEAVSIMMMCLKNIPDKIWDNVIDPNDVISPTKCLYWLSGGDREWCDLKNYNKPWVDCSQKFYDEYGSLVLDIFKNSKTLGDIRDGFIKYLNLPILYDFAIKISIVD